MLGLRVDDEINLAMPLDSHAEPIYTIIQAERDRLEAWLWPDIHRIQSVTYQATRLRARRARLADTKWFSFVIEVSGEVAGTLTINVVEHDDYTTEIGYILAQRFEGRGIITRSVVAVIDAAIDRLGLHRFEIRCAPGNQRSRAIPQRLGFRLEATLSDAAKTRAEFQDQELYAILAPEWRARPRVTTP